MEAKALFSLDFVDLEETELEHIQNDSQVSSSGMIVVPGPYVNEESCPELDQEASKFTQRSTEHFIACQILSWNL